MVPGPDILEQHARRLVEKRLAKKALDNIRDQLAAAAAAYDPPADLADQVCRVLAEYPELSWDMALATILNGS